MTNWQRLFLGVCAMISSGTAFAQAPAPAGGLSAVQLEQAVADSLKEVHNRGADLYNRGDAAGAYRMYEGALSAVRPFVAHRPAILKAIEDGLNETAKTDGVKIQAFRLHEVIEQVRVDLKTEVAKAVAEPVPAVPERAKTDGKKAAVPAPAAEQPGRLSGTMNITGKPLAAADVTVVTLDQPLPRVFTATTRDDGRFEFADELPAGQYAVIVTGKAVPAKFATVTTSPLRFVVAAGVNTLPLDLE